MNYYTENHCRICSKVFCCVNCRCRHEESFHNVDPNCEICIYGRAVINEAPMSLLQHIKLRHWPLHCVFCKKVFKTLDELVPHGKCSMSREYLKMSATPKTPVMEKSEPSVLITPFYKDIIPDLQQIGANTLIGATSTPLIQKDEIGKKEKITPMNQSEIKHVYKSNLKLTGSASLNDSKKSDRRVTFSETPSISEYFKKPKILPLSEQIRNDQNVTDDSYVSVADEELYKTAPTNTSTEKENITDIVCKENYYSDQTEWESALTKLDITASRTPETSHREANNINVSVQINILNAVEKSRSEASTSEVTDDSLNKSTNIWSSVTSMVKSVMSNISFTSSTALGGAKRSLPDSDISDQVPSLKRMKLTELKCRRPIRDIKPLYEVRMIKPRLVHKATQTEESWLRDCDQ